MIQNLPERQIDRIIDLLPQQEVINLALTNFKFYKLCMKKLYRSITLIPTSTLNQNDTRKTNYQDSNKTIVYGLKNNSNKVINLKLIEVRLQVLNQAIQINPELNDYINDIDIFGEYNQAVNNEIHKLLTLAKGAKVFIKNERLRKWVKKYTEINSLVIDNSDELSRDINEIQLNCQLPQHFIDFNRFESILIDDSRYDEFFRYLNEKNLVIAPKAINIKCDHNIKYLDYINFDNIKHLQISLGCNESNCDKECIDDFLSILTDIINWSQITKLNIIQTNPYNHRNSEKIDILVLRFLHKLKFRKLSYLFFKFNTPKDGIIDDGYEGNYLRKLSIYHNLLIKLINSFNTPKINLVLYDFLDVLTCYEQPMNTMMWNGCKCDYCDHHLQLIDDFIMFHKYFNKSEKYWKDLNNSIVLRSLSENFKQRFLVKDYWSINSFPLQYVDWDLHSNDFSPMPLQCLNTESYNQSEFDEDDDVFFDAVTFNCKYEPNKTQKSIFNTLSKCLIHYMDDLNFRVINLNRGDAESMFLTIDDLNDGDTNTNIVDLYTNGFVFCFDRELNGTNYFINFYDN